MTLSEPLYPDLGENGAKVKQLQEKNKILFAPIVLETIWMYSQYQYLGANINIKVPN